MGSSLFRNGGPSAQTTHLIELFSPKIKSFSPKKAPANTKVTISGKGFSGTTKVKFENKKAQIISVSEEEIVVIVPDLGKYNRKVNVTVTTPFGHSKKTKKSEFSYIKEDQSSRDSNSEV